MFRFNKINKSLAYKHESDIFLQICEAIRSKNITFIKNLQSKHILALSFIELSNIVDRYQNIQPFLLILLEHYINYLKVVPFCIIDTLKTIPKIPKDVYYLQYGNISQCKDIDKILECITTNSLSFKFMPAQGLMKPSKLFGLLLGYVINQEDYVMFLLSKENTLSEITSINPQVLSKVFIASFDKKGYKYIKEYMQYNHDNSNDIIRSVIKNKPLDYLYNLLLTLLAVKEKSDNVYIIADVIVFDNIIGFLELLSKEICNCNKILILFQERYFKYQQYKLVFDFFSAINANNHNLGLEILINNDFADFQNNKLFREYLMHLIDNYTYIKLLQLCPKYYEILKEFDKNYFKLKNTYQYNTSQMEIGYTTNRIYKEEVCPICYMDYNDECSLRCGHIFCYSCLPKTEQYLDCPICRETSTLFNVIDDN